MSKTIRELADQAYERHSKDYWEAHAEFGSDQELRLPWFHNVGFESGATCEAVLALRDALERLGKACVMGSREDVTEACIAAGEAVRAFDKARGSHE